MFCFRCPAGAEEDVFVRLSELSVHRHVDNGIDAGREVDQDIADHVGVFSCRGSNKDKCAEYRLSSTLDRNLLSEM